MSEKKPRPRRDRERIRELFVRYGGDAKAVAEEEGASVRQVHRITADLRTPRSPSMVTPEGLAKAKALLEERAGYHEAQRSTGISHTTLRKHFPGMGLTPQESGPIGKMRKELLYLRVH